MYKIIASNNHCELLTWPNGKTYKNWKRENGIITCELKTLPNGKTIQLSRKRKLSGNGDPASKKPKVGS